jgi:hypothetical protein
MTVEVTRIDELLPPGELAAIEHLWHGFPAYTPVGQGSYLRTHPGHGLRAATNPGRFPAAAAVPVSRRFAPGLGFRADSRRNFLRTGGSQRRPADPLLTYRHRYFRETYVYGNTVHLPGIEPVLHQPLLVEAARAGHEGGVVVPAIVYANLMLPGQELGLHHDIPEFRGASVNQLPGWLLVVMHLSGLFERWRLPLATAIVYVNEGGSGGDLLYYPDGVEGSPARFPASRNAAIMFDADSTLHGVDRLAGHNPAIAHIGPGTTLVHRGAGEWELRCPGGDGERIIATYRSEEIRCSLSWKAYWFADQAAREQWAANRDDLDLPTILGILLAALRARGVLSETDHGLSEEELGLLLIDTFVPFPVPSERVGSG